MRGCELCPRRCGADRAAGERGYCGAGADIMAARAAAHMWEEPCLSGQRGSGAVFFSGCALRCVYCQNRPIARMERGQAITVERLAEIFLELQGQGLHNINLVSGSHYTPQIAAALTRAKERGLTLPVVWNSSGYELTATLKQLEGLVDIWLPDMKYISPEPAARYSNAPDYFHYAALALREMVRQCPKPRFDGHGLLRRGVLVRHLALPGWAEDSRAILSWLHESFGNDIYISLMSQYTPMAGAGESWPELGRRLSGAEYEALVDYALDIGIENGFIQEGEAAEESFIPDFNGQGL